MDGQVQQGDGISLVVVSRGMTASTDGRHHLVLAGVAFASGVLLDRAERDTLVRDLVVLAPGGQLAHEAAIRMRGVDTDVAANFFEHHLVNAFIALLDVGEPALEPKEAHAAAFEALGFEGLAATADAAVAAGQCPAGCGAQIEGENGRRVHVVSPCLIGSDAADTAYRYPP